VKGASGGFSWGRPARLGSTSQWNRQHPSFISYIRYSDRARVTYATSLELAFLGLRRHLDDVEVRCVVEAVTNPCDSVLWACGSKRHSLANDRIDFRTADGPLTRLRRWSCLGQAPRRGRGRPLQPICSTNDRNSSLWCGASCHALPRLDNPFLQAFLPINLYMHYHTE
jgi:hypothetical protein